MNKVFEIHIARSFTPALFLQSSNGWVFFEPEDFNLQERGEGEMMRQVILFVSDCPVCCMAADSPAYIVGMN
jgi:hypothetical protein